MNQNNNSVISGTPIIEIATYAGVDVYECYCRGKESSIVMRRLSDDWINITQVFKVASFTKTQRTKILEKESSEMKHEKIQGGYGRFQGTWIPLYYAKTLIEKYKINHVIVFALVQFQPDPLNMPPRRSKNSIIKKLSPATKITSPSSYNKTPKKRDVNGNITSTTKKLKKRSSAKAAQPSPLHNLIFQTPQHQQNQNVPGQNSTILAPEQQTPVGNAGINMNIGINTGANEDSRNYSTTQKPLQFFPYPQKQLPIEKFQDIPISMIPNNTIQGRNLHNQQKQNRPNVQMIKQLMESNQQLSCVNTSHLDTSTQKPVNSNGSNGSSTDYFSSHEDPTPTSSRSMSPKNSHKNSALSVEEYKELVLQVLSSDYNTSEPVLPEKLYRPPMDLDINFLIDDQNHTSLHWATAMANIPLLKILLTLDADMLICNNRGFNCVTKSIFYNNCYKSGAFPTIISMLKPCLITPDSNGRLPIHYLVELSVNKSKDPVIINYYLDVIIELLSNENSSLLKMCLNYQDLMGNTVMHLAALNLNLELCNKLCYLGSSMDFLNSHQQTPASILAKFNLIPPNCNNDINSLSHNQQQLKPSTSIVNENKFNFSNRHINGVSSDSNNIHTAKATIDDRNSVLNTTSSVPKDKESYQEKIMESDSVEKNIKEENKVSLQLRTFHPNPPSNIMFKTQSNNLKFKMVEKSSVSKSTKELFSLVNNLSDSVDSQIGKLELDITKTRDCIKEIDYSLQTTVRQESEIFEQLDVKGLDQLQAKLDFFKHNLRTSIQHYSNSLEKSQALTLATLVQDEESKVQPTKRNLESPKKERKSLELGVELVFLQFKRKHKIEKVCNGKGFSSSSIKLSKYRKLIGMSIENIDSKLDEIEMDLRATT